MHMCRDVCEVREQPRISPHLLLHLRQDLLLLASWYTGPGMRTAELQICVTVPNTSFLLRLNNTPLYGRTTFTYPSIF